MWIAEFTVSYNLLSLDVNTAFGNLLEVNPNIVDEWTCGPNDALVFWLIDLMSTRCIRMREVTVLVLLDF